MTGNKTAW